MSASAVASATSSTSLAVANSSALKRTTIESPLHKCMIPSCRFSTSSLKSSSFNGFSLKIPPGSISCRRSSSIFTLSKRLPAVMEWQDCTVKMEVDVPASTAYNFYSDRESIPKWMPFISTVEVLKDKPDLSRWSLKYKAFGQDIEYSWLARNMQPIPNQKIHWRSLEGLSNRGTVRFYPRGPSSCLIELTVSYEVPQLLIPVASALKPFLESLLRGGLERFAALAGKTN